MPPWSRLRSRLWPRNERWTTRTPSSPTRAFTVPFDGLITRRDRDLGDIVVPGACIFQLISTEDIWVSAWVDESFRAVLQPGQKARIVFRSEPGKDYAGSVIRISREVDRETREFLVDVRPINCRRDGRSGSGPRSSSPPAGKTTWSGSPAR